MASLEQVLALLRGKQVVARYRDYYEGRHPLAFATEKFRSAFGSLFREFAYNLCAAVVDTLADRLQVTGFALEDGTDEQAVAAWDIWQANRMDVRAGQVHVEALRCGNAYVIVWPDADGRPTIYPQQAHQVVVGYDEEQPGSRLWAAKWWRIADGRVRVNLYTPEAIEKYVTARGCEGALPERESALVPWPEEPVVENPWGVVPVVELANDPDIPGHGTSELRDVIPLQNALNKQICDLLVAMEYVALPQRWATGLEVELDPATGKPRAPFVPGVDRMWAVGDPEARFGEFSPADLTQMLAVVAEFELKVARVCGIPPHYLSLVTEPPSGEALKTLEARFVKRVLDRQVVFGNAWEDALALALRMAGYGEARLSCQWQDPAPVSTREAAETATLQVQAGVPRRQVLRELGYSELQIERMLAEDEAGAKELSDRLLAAFDRGEQ